jgi:hypothetical protein
MSPQVVTLTPVADRPVPHPIQLFRRWLPQPPHHARRSYPSPRLHGDTPLPELGATRLSAAVSREKRRQPRGAPLRPRRRAPRRGRRRLGRHGRRRGAHAHRDAPWRAGHRAGAPPTRRGGGGRRLRPLRATLRPRRGPGRHRPRRGRRVLPPLRARAAAGGRPGEAGKPVRGGTGPHRRRGAERPRRHPRPAAVPRPSRDPRRRQPRLRPPPPPLPCTELASLGLLVVVSAVESLSARVLDILDEGPRPPGRPPRHRPAPCPRHRLLVEATRTVRLLAEAERDTSRFGLERIHIATAFGLGNLHLYGIGMAVELGDPQSAVRRAAGLNPSTCWPSFLSDGTGTGSMSPAPMRRCTNPMTLSMPCCAPSRWRPRRFAIRPRSATWCGSSCAASASPSRHSSAGWRSG